MFESLKLLHTMENMNSLCYLLLNFKILHLGSSKLSSYFEIKLRNGQIYIGYRVTKTQVFVGSNRNLMSQRSINIPISNNV